MKCKTLTLSLLLSLAASPALATDQYLVRVPANVNLSAPPPPSAPLAVSLGATPLHQAIVGESYTFDFTSLLSISGGAGSGYNLGEVAWSLDSGTLPAGLTLNANGTIGGTPTEAKTSDFALRATYKTASGVQAYQLVSAQIVVTLQSATLPAAMVDTDYAPYDFKSRLTVTGDPAYAVENVSFSATGLPQGMTLSSVGVLSGKPTTKNAAGASFEVKASYKGKDGQQVYTIVVNGVELQVTQISAGGRYTCAVTAEGAAKCWGRNNEGQLGDGTGVSSLTPVAVMGLPTSVTQLASGSAHTCAIASEGALYCWGYNIEGKLGTGDKLSRYSAVRVTGIAEPVRQVSTGSSHTCVVTTAGRALCWGFNGDGRLGVGNFTEQLTPVTVSGMASGVQQVAAGGHLSCAVTTSGAAKCWGNNHLGQLGNGGGPGSSIPVDVTGLSSGVAHIVVGLAHACARLNTGSVRCWGANDVGQLGDGSFTQRNSPVAVSTLTGIATIDIGWNHTCARTATGELRCWGANEQGQLGDGTQTVRNTPGAVPQLGAVSMLSAGMYHTCAAALASAPKCWGSNDMGQLGDGTTVLRTTPVSVRNK